MSVENCKKEYDVSVIVVTYNPDYVKLFNTLYSIINQEQVSLEIVISDDGSKEFDKAKIEKWFFENNFKNYIITGLIENQGTVANLKNAIKNSCGKYIKTISPGDYLYDKNSLFKLLNIFKKHNPDLIFSSAIYYSEINNSIIINENKREPVNVKPYIENNKKKIIKNYFFNNDFILGSSIIYNIDFAKKYFLSLPKSIVYTEDTALFMAIADKKEFYYCKEPTIWYEIGSGISTSKSSIWEQRIRHDQLEAYKNLVNFYPQYQFYLDLFVKKKCFSVFCARLWRKFFAITRNKVYRNKITYDIKLLESIKMGNNNGNKKI